MKLFPRKCSACNKGMAEGYLFGDEPYCSDECAFSSKEELKEFEDMWAEAIRLDELANDTCHQDAIDSYWTDWCLEEGDEAYTAEGIEVDPDEGAKP